MLSKILRIAGLVVGVAFLITCFLSMQDGFPLSDVWVGFFIGVLFVIYGVGGNSLMQRVSQYANIMLLRG